MIFCFSGNGNTLFVARELARKFDDEVVRIGSSPAGEYDMCCQRRVIWTFPVYSWGIPPVVMRFMREVRLLMQDNLPHFMVCTCGDDAGLTAGQWRRIMVSRGWNPVSAHSVIMPNTYVLLPGFDVDTPEVAETKLRNAAGRIEHIAHAIKCMSPIDDITCGTLAWLKSRVVYPVFTRFMMSGRPLHASDACVGCGACVSACPMENITLTDTGIPQWGGNCALCLGCYHVCPHHAVAYGNRTARKGQYRIH